MAADKGKDPAGGNGRQAASQNDILFDFAPENAAKVLELSPLALAFVGDAVHNLYVRTRLAQTGGKARDMHLDTCEQVRAQAQAKAALELMPQLSTEEKRVYLRGRNAKSANVPKHAEVGEYRSATGFEALLGFLYLTARRDRLYELLDAAGRFQDG